MPIRSPDGLRRLSDEEFTGAAYEVMRVVFAVHNEFGRLFDERIYENEIARRLGNARTQIALDIWFESFRKRYYLDLLYSNGALFELKASEGVVERHRAHLLNYLLILELPHGKLVNLGTEAVQHEFVNAPLSRTDRTSFTVETNQFKESASTSIRLPDLMVSLLRDWGTCLQVGLYEEVITHFLGGDGAVLKPVEVLADGRAVGTQIFRLLAPDTAFKITGFEGARAGYEIELRRLLQHTPLNHMQWVNVGRKMVTFKTLSK